MDCRLTVGDGVPTAKDRKEGSTDHVSLTSNSLHVFIHTVYGTVRPSPAGWEMLRIWSRQRLHLYRIARKNALNLNHHLFPALQNAPSPPRPRINRPRSPIQRHHSATHGPRRYLTDATLDPPLLMRRSLVATTRLLLLQSTSDSPGALPP